MGLSMRLQLGLQGRQAGFGQILRRKLDGGDLAFFRRFRAHAARGIDLHAGGKLDGPEPRLPRQAVEPHLATHAVQLPDDVQKCRLAGMIQIADGLGDDHSHQPCGGRFIERLGMIAQQQQDLPAALFQPAIGDGRMLGAANLCRQVAARNIVNLQQLVHDLFQIGVFQGAVQLGQGDRAKIDAERLGQAVGRLQALVERFQDPLQHGPRRLHVGGQMPETPHGRGPQPKADQVVQHLPFAVADHGTDLFQAKEFFGGRDEVAFGEPQPEADQVQPGNFAQPGNEVRIGRNLFQRLKFVELELSALQAPIQGVEALGVLLENLAGKFQPGPARSAGPTSAAA